MSSAAARLPTRTHSMRPQIRWSTPAGCSFDPAAATRAPGGISLRKATFGLPGSREIANPISRAISTG